MSWRTCSVPEEDDIFTYCSTGIECALRLVVGTLTFVVGTPRHNVGTPRHVVATPRHVIGANCHVISTLRLVISTPRYVIGASRVVAEAPRCIQACFWHFQMLPRLSLNLLCPPRFFAGASRCTCRSLHWSSKLWDLTTLGFKSDNSPSQKYILLMLGTLFFYIFW